MSQPFLSVVMPVHRALGVLGESLTALLTSDLPRSDWELIIVDDSSGDETPDMAARYADRLVRLTGGARGPAYARNRGVEVSRGEVVVFVDADVCVHGPTLSRIAAAFRADAGLTAVFGSYDADPRAPGVVSQFRNLLHHHVHQCNPGPAETFWAGCGAVRRVALLDVGLMDAWHFPRPQIEDIELGRRLRRAGHRIELHPDIQCTHLKRWTLRTMVLTDLRDRGIPWMRLLLAEGRTGTPATLNLRAAEKACTVMVALVLLALPIAVLFRSFAALAVAALAVIVVVLLNRRFYRTLARARGVPFALAGVPLHLVFYATGGLAGVIGILQFYTRPVPQPAGRSLQQAVPEAGWPPPVDRPVNSVWALTGGGTRK